MREKTFAWILLTVPFMLGAISWLCISCGVETILGFYLAMAIVYGGVPYLITLIGFAIWSRKKSTEELLNAVPALPFLMMPTMVLYGLLSSILPLPEAYKISFEAAIALCAFVLMFGYTYIFIGFAVFFGLRALGWIKEDKREAVLLTLPPK